jgi:hypothetical protein
MGFFATRAVPHDPTSHGSCRLTSSYLQAALIALWAAVKP